MAATKAPSPAMEFLVSSLTKNKTASYADLKAKADEKKLEVYPIMFGRAQALLGIVKSAKRGKGKAKMAAAAKAAKAAGSAAPAKRGRPADASSKSARVRELLNTGMSPNDIAAKVGCTVGLVYNIKSTSGMTGRAVVKRRPGRPRKVAAAASLDGFAGIVEAVKNGERERAQLRAALGRIQGILAETLG
ncbi:MAG: hypothetical protein ABIS67_05880 [Candidatus Eisenbacteria bacterium]